MFKVRTITLTNASGLQSFNGFGFKPQALLFFSTMNTAPDTFSTDLRISVGFCDASLNQTWVATHSNAVAPSAANRNAGTAKVWENITSSSAGPQAAVNSLDADGFTLNLSSAPGAAFTIGVVAFSEATNAKCSTFNLATAGATQAVTGVGFQPELIFWVYRRSTGSGGATPLSTSGSIAFGVSTGASEEGGCGGGFGTGQNPPDNAIYFSTTTPIAVGARNAEDDAFNLASFDSDGFTINLTNPANTASTAVGFLAINGLTNQKVLNETQKTSTGTKAKTGYGFQPNMMLFFGCDATTSVGYAINSNPHPWIGASDGTDEFVQWCGHDDAGTNARRRSSDTKAAAGMLASGTMSAEADLASFDSDGFTLDWTTADGTARLFNALGLKIPGSRGITNTTGVVGQISEWLT